MYWHDTGRNPKTNIRKFSYDHELVTNFLTSTELSLVLFSYAFGQTFKFLITYMCAITQRQLENAENEDRGLCARCKCQMEPDNASGDAGGQGQRSHDAVESSEKDDVEDKLPSGIKITSEIGKHEMPDRIVINYKVGSPVNGLQQLSIDNGLDYQLRKNTYYLLDAAMRLYAHAG